MPVNMVMIADVDVVHTNRSTVIHNAVHRADRKIRAQSHSDILEKVVFGDLILVATSVGILDHQHCHRKHHSCECNFGF